MTKAPQFLHFTWHRLTAGEPGVHQLLLKSALVSFAGHSNAAPPPCIKKTEGKTKGKANAGEEELCSTSCSQPEPSFEELFHAHLRSRLSRNTRLAAASREEAAEEPPSPHCPGGRTTGHWGQQQRGCLHQALPVLLGTAAGTFRLCLSMPRLHMGCFCMCLQLGALQPCKWLVCRARCLLLGLSRTCLQSPCSCFVSHSSQGRSKGQPAAAESEVGWGQDAGGGSHLRVERNHHWEP